MILNNIIEQDEQDVIQHERKVVTPGEPQKQKLLNGVTFGRVLQLMRQSIVKEPNVAKVLLNVDPALGSMVDSMEYEVRLLNWKLIARELKKFGIILLKEVSDRILGKDELEVIELLRFLLLFEKSGGSAAVAKSLQVANLQSASAPLSGGLMSVHSLPFIKITLSQEQDTGHGRPGLAIDIKFINGGND